MSDYIFKKAKPIWAKGRETQKNLQLSFKTIIVKEEGTILKIAGSTVYKIFINGNFFAIGPGRSGSGYYKVDEFNISNILNIGENSIVIQVIGYNVNSYYTLNQPSFLTCEIEQKGNITSYTGSESFKCKKDMERIEKVQRYSFQRPFIEIYKLDKESENFKNSLHLNFEPIEIQEVSSKNYLKRDVRYPNYEKLPVSQIVSSGNADFNFKCDNIYEDRSYTNIDDKLLGYKKEDLKEHLSSEIQNIKYSKDNTIREISSEYMFKENNYITFSFPYNATGMISLNISTLEDLVLYYTFDEILEDGEIDVKRMGSCNGIKYYLKKGEYNLITFEPYTLKYLNIITKGNCIVSNVHIIEYKHPQVKNRVKLPQGNDKLKTIYDSALETFLANSVDAFTDCPSRERAGWLCDSFFTARVENCLTGESILEKSFLNNFIIAKEFPHIPEGMLPMCYPADHNDGVFIPSWAMWFVLELEEYYQRTKDEELVNRAKERVYKLKEYFITFENEFGLLQNLDSWVFVEWSKAGEFVQDVNFPSNMIYSKMLESIGRLYKDDSLIKKSEKIKETIREKSFNGEFFTDNQVIENNILVNPNNTSEVCQYYAFFTGVATPKTYSDLWNKLVNDFGPERKENNKYPNVYFANAFIGNYLRLEILYNNGYKEKVLENIEGYFYEMGIKTGTLWEHDNTSASCNHGFASHVICWMAGIYGLE